MPLRAMRLPTVRTPSILRRGSVANRSGVHVVGSGGEVKDAAGAGAGHRPRVHEVVDTDSGAESGAGVG